MDRPLSTADVARVLGVSPSRACARWCAPGCASPARRGRPTRSRSRIWSCCAPPRPARARVPARARQARARRAGAPAARRPAAVGRCASTRTAATWRCATATRLAARDRPDAARLRGRRPGRAGRASLAQGARPRRRSPTPATRRGWFERGLELEDDARGGARRLPARPRARSRAGRRLREPRPPGARGRRRPQGRALLPPGARAQPRRSGACTTTSRWRSRTAGSRGRDPHYSGARARSRLRRRALQPGGPLRAGRPRADALRHYRAYKQLRES